MIYNVLLVKKMLEQHMCIYIAKSRYALAPHRRPCLTSCRAPKYSLGVSFLGARLQPEDVPKAAFTQWKDVAKLCRSA